MSKNDSGLRVVEIGRTVSVSYCARLLANIGANIVKIDQSESGDPLRSAGLFPQDASDATVGALFNYLNDGKKVIQSDLSRKEDVAALLDIIASADAVIESLGPSGLEELGLGFDQMSSRNPGICVIRISDFGQDGPMCDVPATDFTVQAAAAWVWKHYAPGRDPVKVGGYVTEYIAGVHAACAALMACRIAKRGDTAVMVDVSKQECLLSTLSQPALQTKVLNELGWGPQEERIFPIPGVRLCKDGYVGINVLTARHFEDFCNLVGIPQHIPHRMELQLPGPLLDAFYADIEPWLRERTVDEIVEICQTFRIPAAPVSNGQMLLEMPQLKERGFYTKQAGADFLKPGDPWRLEIRPEIARTSLEEEGTRDLSSEGIWKSKEVRPASPDKSEGGGKDTLPFEGLQVLDMGIMWAGPYVGCCLGAFGADVIKVESIQRPDPYRFSGSYLEQGKDWYERSALFQGTNLNKRDLTLDLNHDNGKQLFQKLVARSDILIENFSPRVLNNFGFSPERLREINPALIILRMPGFGLEGPWKDYVSFAMSIEQASGLAYVTGRPNEPPLNPGGFVDPAASMHALVALQHALIHRERTGEGQLIEVPQVEVGAFMTAEQVIAYSMTGKLLGRNGNRSETMAPQGVYPCLENEWVAISIRDDEDWQRFIELLGDPDWAREVQLGTVQGRRQHHDEIDERISGWSISRKADALVSDLHNFGIPASRVLTSARMYGDPHLEFRGFYQELEHDRAGPGRYAGWPMKFSSGPTTHHRKSAPTLGEHNVEILTGDLGLSMNQVEELAENGIIGTAPKGLG
ncbi:MAG: CoA transferase [Dehalococcoidia bacterium]